MKTEEYAHLYSEMQEDYLNDIDLSGGLFLEFEKVSPGLNEIKN